MSSVGKGDINAARTTVPSAQEKDSQENALSVGEAGEKVKISQTPSKATHQKRIADTSAHLSRDLVAMSGES